MNMAEKQVRNQINQTSFYNASEMNDSVQDCKTLSFPDVFSPEA